MKKKIRSPFFYVGDKYKLMPQLKHYFPENIKNFYDVFCGGGSASISIEAKNFFLNDVDTNIIELHKRIYSKSVDISKYIDQLNFQILRFELSRSEVSVNKEIVELKKTYKKTYFSKYNKSAYLKLRDEYNKTKDIDLLYLLLIYGFNHMLRFNSKGEFNLPVGNVDWNKNVTQALHNYSNWASVNNIKYSNLDFENFIKSSKFEDDDFIYLDPPYLITMSEYNKLWKESDEIRLYELLDDLNEKGITWGLSNMYSHKGIDNNILIEWSKKYTVYIIESNYISRFDNTTKHDSIEVYVTNKTEEN